jgi:hypothetical protein
MCCRYACDHGAGATGIPRRGWLSPVLRAADSGGCSHEPQVDAPDRRNWKFRPEPHLGYECSPGIKADNNSTGAR